MRCEFCKIWLPIILLVVGGFYLAYQFVPPLAGNELRIATGSKSGAYYQYALQYQQALQKEDINLIIQPTAGSVEALQLLSEGKVDLAFIQGGVTNNFDNNEVGLYSIASLFYEPLWGFVRKNLEGVDSLAELKGKRLAIGVEGSGTRSLLMQLLESNGINKENTALLGLRTNNVETMLANNEVDAAFFVTSPMSNTVSKFASDPDLDILDFSKRALAYTGHYPFLSALPIGMGLIDLTRNIPDKDLTVLSPIASLLAVNDIHPDHVRLLSREAVRVHSKAGLLEKAREFPSIDYLEIPIHPEAKQYLQRGPSWLEKIFPFSVAAALDRLKIMLIPLLTLLFPLIKGVIPLYQWRMRSRNYRWYERLYEADLQVVSEDIKVLDQEIDKMQKLHGELLKEVSVPLSYMSEFYQLRNHTNLVLNQLQFQREKILDKS